MNAVDEAGDRMVYKVASDTVPGGFHTVDLLYGGGAGYCSCRDHQTRRQPFIDKGGDPFSRQGFCKHTERARTHFLRQLLTHMAEAEQ